MVWDERHGLIPDHVDLSLSPQVLDAHIIYAHQQSLHCILNFILGFCSYLISPHAT